MPIVKILYRTIIFTILFCLLRIGVHTLTDFFETQSLTVDKIIEFATIEYIQYIFLIVSVPFLVSSTIYFYFHDKITKVIYWINGSIPIGIFIYGANMVTNEFTDLKEYMYLLIPIFLFIAFYYNYRMINKELKKNDF